MQKIKLFVAGHKIMAGVAVLAVVVLGAWYKKSHSSAQDVQYVTQAAQKTTISVSVSASGQISAESQVDLKPGGSGALFSVNVKAGDTVKAGQILAVVDQRSNSVAVAQAKAQVAQAQASLDKTLAGLTGNDLASAKLTLDMSAQALEKARRDYDQAVRDQQAAVDKAHSDYLNTGLGLEPSNNFSTAEVALSGSYTGSIEGAYDISIYNTAGGLYYRSGGLGSGSGPVQRGSPLPLGNGLYVTFGQTGNLDSSTTWKVEVPNIKSASYLSSRQNYQSSLDSKESKIQAAKDTVTSAENNFKSAQLAFDTKIAPADNATVAQARASLLSARAALQKAVVDYDNNNIKAPFDGVVAAVNYKKGDQVTNATVVATLITRRQLAVVSLNEVDAAKVLAGQKAILTFDALDGLEATGRVAEVGALGSVSQGVVSYTVKIALDTQDERIKPGMSVSASIIGEVKTDVLAVPASAVKTGQTGKYVQVLSALGQPQNINVETGISNDTLVEITSGLNEGQEVVTQTITSSSSSSRTTTTGIPGLNLGRQTGTGTTRAGGQNQVFIQR